MGHRDQATVFETEEIVSGVCTVSCFGYVAQLFHKIIMYIGRMVCPVGKEPFVVDSLADMHRLEPCYLFKYGQLVVHSRVDLLCHFFFGSLSFHVEIVVLEDESSYIVCQAGCRLIKLRDELAV